MAADFLKERIAEIVRIFRDAEAADAGTALTGDLYEDQPVRFRYRQTTQADGIQKLKYGRVGADPERQCGDRSQREGRCFAQNAACVSQVVDRAFEEAGAPHIAALLLNLRDAAQAPQRRGPRR